MSSQDLQTMLRGDMQRGWFDEADNILEILATRTAGKDSPQALYVDRPNHSSAMLLDSCMPVFDANPVPETPRRHYYRYQRARITSWQNRWDEAERMWDEASARFPNHDVFREVHEHRSAWSSTTQALAGASNNPEIDVTRFQCSEGRAVFLHNRAVLSQDECDAIVAETEEVCFVPPNQKTKKLFMLLHVNMSICAYNCCWYQSTHLTRFRDRHVAGIGSWLDYTTALCGSNNRRTSRKATSDVCVVQEAAAR